jgi:hypothetical protein
MAKTYQQRNNASILNTGKSLYEKRIERASAQGLSRSQARGHARAKKGETPISAIKRAMGVSATPLKTRPAVKSSKLPSDLRKQPRATEIGGSKVYTVRSEQAAYNKLQEAARQGKRVVVSVYSTNTGQGHILYTGARMQWGGINAKYLLEQMEEHGRTLDEQLDYDYSHGSYGFLPELDAIGQYTIQYVA